MNELLQETVNQIIETRNNISDLNEIKLNLLSDIEYLRAELYMDITDEPKKYGISKLTKDLIDSIVMLNEPYHILVSKLKNTQIEIFTQESNLKNQELILKISEGNNQ